MKKYRDKYGFKSLLVGEWQIVWDVEPKHAQMTFAQYKKRYPHLAFRQFLWWKVLGGTKVERVG